MKLINKATAALGREKNEVLDSNLEKVKILTKGGVVLGALVCGVFVFGCKRVFAVESAVAALLLTKITPKSIAVHNATEVARFVVRPVAWLSLVLYPVGRVVAYLSMGMLKALGLNGRSEPYVTEDELKLMLRGAELSGAIEEEEQVMKLMNYNFPIFSQGQGISIPLPPSLRGIS
ncbi:hypothetical protein Pint_03935 [Pistacia integerrima]|uniref:Uncharacterized protein n=1 Tax=Pistacia integerrima TaxID=434235 RepID=A0ACC0Z3J5_9ROSI|nr:hypothetical protein Pint_03935 [Pistacia integerrima]